MKKHILLASFAGILILSACHNKKYEMYNMMPMNVDISEYINKGDYSVDSCNHHLSRLKHNTAKPLVADDEVLLQARLLKWRVNYNKWLKKNNQDTLMFTAEQLFEKTKYQYSYVVTNSPVDVYKTETGLRINGIENLHLYIQLNEKGELISDYTENNYVDTACDSINSVDQEIYKKKINS